MPWKAVQPVLDPHVRDLCSRRYPGHPHGCPNRGRRDTCPPKAPLLGQVVQLDWPIWVVWSAFNLAAHARRMRRRHPGWSWRQLSCCRYWQAGARRKLTEEVLKLLRLLGGGYPVAVVRCPEACGVDVTATMALAGVKLEWPPRELARQVALVGSPREDR